MSASVAPFGTENALDLQASSQYGVDTSSKLASLQDLLDAFQLNPPEQHSMLRSTAGKLGEYFQRSCDDIPLASLIEEREAFRQYLRNLPYAKNSIKTYSNYVNILIAKARELGWTYCEPVLPQVWIPLAEAITKKHCDRVLRYVVKLGRVPSEVAEEDLYDWVREMVATGGSYDHVQLRANAFRRLLVKAGFTQNLSTRRVRLVHYGLPLKHFPATLRSEVEEVLAWKQADFARSRPSKARIRPVTAEALRNSFCCLTGFAIGVQGLDTIESIKDLFTEKIATEYVEWAIQKRLSQGKTLANNLGRIHAALKHHPNYKDMDLSWIKQLTQTLPVDSDEALVARKNDKYLRYEVLEKIPEKIRSGRSKAARYGSKAVALQVRDELLIKWMLTLPWRQRNLREMRIVGSTPNLFKAPVQARSNVSKPDWLLEEEKHNPGVEAWQFRFSKAETKMGNLVHAVVPRSLVKLLDEYLNKHRKDLVQGVDPGTLFLGVNGKALSSAQLRKLVSELTLRHGGRIVTPHLFRDIFAFMLLEKHPESYLNLSKLLWHRNINTTLHKYGQRYNESAALCWMEGNL